VAAIACALALTPVGCGASRSSQSTSRPTSGLLAFGEEATGTVRAAISAPLIGYLKALRRAEGGLACSYLAPALRSEAFVEESRGGPRQRCARGLEGFEAQAGEQAAAERIKIQSVRVSGSTAYVIYRAAPGAPVQFFPLIHKAGRWRLFALGATELPDVGSE
jgi:hypothetical protein